MTATRTQIARLAVSLAVLGSVASGFALPARAGGDWNDEGIKWVSYADGLVKAKKGKKPICLIFYTEWCPHCTSYSKVFHDPVVVKKSKRFVMVRVDKDKDAQLSGEFSLDGSYIPRTYFLDSAGKVDPEIHAARDEYKYFYDEADPAAVLAAMDVALRKLNH